MKTGRKPKPTQLHRLHGTFNATRHAERAHEAKADGDLAELEPPDDLTEAERDCWRFTIDNAPRGVLKRIDRGVLRIWVKQEARFLLAASKQEELNRRGGLPLLVKNKAGDLVISPYINLMDRCSKIMLGAAEQLGFSPIARPRLAGEREEEEDDDRWAQLAALRRKAANG